MKDLNDIQIVEGCAKSDSLYQEQLFFRYSETLMATCLRYMGSHADAEDVLQDAFMLIFDRIHQFDAKKGSLRNWLITICVNQCLKKIGRSPKILTLDPVIEISSQQDIIADLQYQDLYQLILDLDVPYRTVVNLHMVEGYSHKEIGEMIGVRESSSRSILSRAKTMLKERINNGLKTTSWTA